jgi:hypothetical protein
MISREQLPTEAVEAAARKLAECHSTEANWELFVPRAEASLMRAFDVWPGYSRYPRLMRDGKELREHICLPLNPKSKI